MCHTASDSTLVIFSRITSSGEVERRRTRGPKVGLWFVPVAEFNFSEARLGLASVLPEITLYFNPYKTRSGNALLSCDWITQENGSDLG